MTTADARRQLRATDVKRLNRGWRRSTESRLGLLVESVTQPFNVGSIVRSAAAFGVERLWLAGNATPPDHPNARKTGLGTERLLPWEPAVPVPDAVRAVREAGLRIVAVELTNDAVPLHEAPLDGDVCLAVGGEDHGCSPPCSMPPTPSPTSPRSGGSARSTSRSPPPSRSPRRGAASGPAEPYATPARPAVPRDLPGPTARLRLAPCSRRTPAARSRRHRRSPSA